MNELEKFNKELEEYEEEYQQYVLERQNKYQKEHRTECRVNEQRYRDSHQEQRYAYQIEWNNKNKDKRAKYCKGNRERHRAAGTTVDRTVYLADYYQKNKERIKERDIQRRLR